MIGGVGSSFTAALPDLAAAAATGSASATGLLKQYESLESDSVSTLLGSLPGPTYNPAGNAASTSEIGQLLNVQA